MTSSLHCFAGIPLRSGRELLLAESHHNSMVQLSSPAQPGTATEVDVQGSPSIPSDLASLASQVQQMSADNAFSQQQMQQMHASQAVVQRQMQALLALLQQSNQPQQLAAPRPPPLNIPPPLAPSTPTQLPQIPTGHTAPMGVSMVPPLMANPTGW